MKKLFIVFGIALILFGSNLVSFICGLEMGFKAGIMHGVATCNHSMDECIDLFMKVSKSK